MVGSYNPVQKGNKFHDPHTGEFSHGDGESNCTPAVIKQQLDDLGLAKHFDHRDWSIVMPKVSPKEFFGAFVGKEGVTKENLSGIKSGVVDLQGIKFGFKDLNVHGVPAKSLTREIDFTRREAKHEMLDFDTAKSGGGIAKKMLGDCVKLYDKIGVDKIRLFAGLELGAYTWGKFGFRYADPVTASDHMDMVSNNALMSLKRFGGKDKFNPDEKAEVHALARVLDAKDATGSTPLFANQLLSNMKTPHLDAHFADDIAQTFPKKGTFMKWVMDGTAYDGVLDLKDKNQRATLHKYVST